MKKHVVRKIYERCDEVSAIYIKKHPEDWLLGGESTILVVDEFPGGYMTECQKDINSAKKRNNNSHTIICIAEVNTIPTRLWLHMIETVSEVLCLLYNISEHDCLFTFFSYLQSFTANENRQITGRC